MSLIQKLVRLLPRKWADDIQTESESWILHCPECKSSRTLWEIGGVRYKATSNTKVVSAKCKPCGQVRMMRMEKTNS